MKIKALKTFYADAFGRHLTEGETAEIKAVKEEKKNQRNKTVVKNYVAAGLVEMASSNAKVGLQKTSVGVEILKEAKKKADKIEAGRMKRANNTTKQKKVTSKK